MQSAAKSSAILICSAILAFGATAAFAVDGAKDMFYRQLSRPTEQINTGVQYWIELRRNGQTSRVNNKFDFQSGDRIKFHVKSNISGFAYVVLKEGSKGEHAVLFPDSKLQDDNRVKASVDYAIPSDGYLLFDSQPGSEKLMLILSREAIRPDDWIRNTTRPRVLVASRQPGAKDLVPGTAVVGFDDSPQIADLPAPAPSTTLVSSNGESNTSPATNSPGTPVVANDTNNGTNSPLIPASMANSVTTVVEKDPKLVLALDIVLTHRP